MDGVHTPLQETPISEPTHKRKCLGSVSEEEQSYFPTPAAINQFRQRTLMAAQTIKGKVAGEENIHVVPKHCSKLLLIPKRKTYADNGDNGQSPPSSSDQIYHHQ